MGIRIGPSAIAVDGHRWSFSGFRRRRNAEIYVKFLSRSTRDLDDMDREWPSDVGDESRPERCREFRSTIVCWFAFVPWS